MSGEHVEAEVERLAAIDGEAERDALAIAHLAAASGTSHHALASYLATKRPELLARRRCEAMLLDAELRAGDPPATLDDIAASPEGGALAARVALQRGALAVNADDWDAVRVQLAAARAGVTASADPFELACVACLELVALARETQRAPTERGQALRDELSTRAKDGPHVISLDMALVSAAFDRRPQRVTTMSLGTLPTLLQQVDGERSDLEALVAEWPEVAKRGHVPLRGRIDALGDRARTHAMREAWLDLARAFIALHVSEPDKAAAFAARVVREVPDHSSYLLVALGLRLTATLALLQFETARAIAALRARVKARLARS